MPGVTSANLITMGVGALLMILWLFFYFKGMKYNEMFEALDDKEFRLKEIYGFGYGFLETFKYSYKTKADRKLRQPITSMYGDKYCEYYLRVLRSQQVTYAALFVLLAFIMYGLSGGNLIILVLLIAIAAIMPMALSNALKNKLEKKSEEMLADFSDVVSKLALLTNAGMNLHEAWQTVADTGDGIIYKEMRNSVLEMENGSSEVDAIYHFGLRCMVPEIKKFASTITAGLTKGNAELSAMLQTQSKESWGMKKQLVRRAGEKAASKLLIPILIMFIGILIMIMVPIMGNMGI